MNDERNAEVLDGMRLASRRIAPAVTTFAERMRDLDIHVGVHNYEGHEGETVLLIVARGERADQLEALVDKWMENDWQADTALVSSKDAA